MGGSEASKYTKSIDQKMKTITAFYCRKVVWSIWVMPQVTPSRIMDGSFANQVLAQMHLFKEKFADFAGGQKSGQFICQSAAKNSR